MPSDEQTNAADAAGEAAQPEDNSIPITLVDLDDAEAVLAGLSARDRAWAEIEGFRGRLGQILKLTDDNGALSAIYFGWGNETTRARTRFHLGDLAKVAPEGIYHLENNLGSDEGTQVALGWLLGRYRYSTYKSAPAAQAEAYLSAPDSVDGHRLIRMVEGVFLTRDLINSPANAMGPSALENTAGKVAERLEASVETIVGDDLIDQNFPLIYTVGRAGADEPRLIDITWGDESHPKVTLVGKGVCFDTGGLNIKPGGSMGPMKKDMGGAATVLGLGYMIMALGLPIRLRILIPAVENAISATAMRPGDIYRSRLGKTVEINNTDAEGRLVLADALAYAVEDTPELIIDMATLTGAARVALGPEVVPFFTDDEDLAEELIAASKAEADPVWRLPLWPGYEGDIEPDAADLDNAPKGGFAGSITAALFLKRFVGDIPWVHFDLYGWNPSSKPGRPKGGECQAARAVLRVLKERYGSGAA